MVSHVNFPHTGFSPVTSAPIPPIEQMALALEFAELTHVLHKGTGDEITFLLDGGPGIAHYLWTFFSRLKIPGLLIGFDPFGTGETKTPPNFVPSPENLALQFSGLVLKYAKPGQPIKIIAHSFGAVIIRLALEQVFKWHSYDITLLLIDPCPFTSGAAIGSAFNLAAKLHKAGVNDKEILLKNKYNEAVQTKDQESINRIGTEMLALEMPYYFEIKDAIPLALPECDNPFNPIFENTCETHFAKEYYDYDWTEYPYPSKTVIVAGREDPFRFGPLPSSIQRSVILENAGHYSYAEQSAQFIDSVQDILFSSCSPR